MSATLANVVQVRSQLVIEVLAYLDDLATRMAELPGYYPQHVQIESIRQTVQVIEERQQYERWRAEEREWLRASGHDVEHLAYAPRRSRAESGEDQERRADRPAPPPPIPWDETAAERFKRAIILGDPGFGKTWLLKYEARRIALEQARRVREHNVNLEKDLVFPIFVRLSQLQSNDPIEQALVNLVCRKSSIAGFRAFVERKLTTEHCVVLLDAWDEVPVEVPPDGQPLAFKPHYRQRLGERLEAFARQFSAPRLLLTSRIVGYDQEFSSPLPDHPRELELLAFDGPQIESFARAWFADATPFLSMLQQTHQVRGLARIPLMLALMCRAYQEKQLAFPTRRADLYDRCLRGLLREWKQEKERREISVAYVDRLLRMLADVGCVLFEHGLEQFSETVLADEIEQWLKGQDVPLEFRKSTPTLLIEKLKREGILIKVGDNSDAPPLLFLHRTFHEYLTARSLARQGWQTIAAQVDKKAWSPRWREVITLLAGQLEDPVPLLTMLHQKEPTETNPYGDDFFSHRLALAAQCLPEAHSTLLKHKSTEIADRVTTNVFNLWWGHQQNYTTEVVSHLTAALPALGQVNAQVPPGTPLLVHLSQLLTVRDWRIRQEAVKALGVLGIGAATAEVLTVLLTTLRTDEDAGVRGYAAEVLGALGSGAAAAEVLTALLTTLRTDENALVREVWVVRTRRRRCSRRS